MVAPNAVIITSRVSCTWHRHQIGRDATVSRRRSTAPTAAADGNWLLTFPVTSTEPRARLRGDPVISPAVSQLAQGSIPAPSASRASRAPPSGDVAADRHRRGTTVPRQGATGAMNRDVVPDSRASGWRRRGGRPPHRPPEGASESPEASPTGMPRPRRQSSIAAVSSASEASRPGSTCPRPAPRRPGPGWSRSWARGRTGVERPGDGHDLPDLVPAGRRPSGFRDHRRSPTAEAHVSSWVEAARPRPWGVIDSASAREVGTTRTSMPAVRPQHARPRCRRR